MPFPATIGLVEALVVVGVLVVLLGAGRLSGILRNVGAGVREFKKGIKEGEPPRP
jgi:TatA/E family protein of Tat protein translocase